MATSEAKAFVKRYIESDTSNPTTDEFSKAMQQLKANVLDELAQYCDELKSRYIAIHGPAAPGIAVCDQAKSIILKSK